MAEYLGSNEPLDGHLESDLDGLRWMTTPATDREGAAIQDFASGRTDQAPTSGDGSAQAAAEVARILSSGDPAAIAKLFASMDENK